MSSQQIAPANVKHNLVKIAKYSPCACLYCNRLISGTGAALQCVDCQIMLHSSCADKALALSPYNSCFAQVSPGNVHFNTKEDELFGNACKLDIIPERNVLVIQKTTMTGLKNTEYPLSRVKVSRQDDKKLTIRVDTKKQCFKFDSSVERDGCYQMLVHRRQPKPKPKAVAVTPFGQQTPTGVGYQPVTPVSYPGAQPSSQQQKPSPFLHGHPSSTTANLPSLPPLPSSLPPESSLCPNPVLQVASAPTIGWQCLSCTFINEGNPSVCSMCDGPRPPSSARPSFSHPSGGNHSSPSGKPNSTPTSTSPSPRPPTVTPQGRTPASNANLNAEWPDDDEEEEDRGKVWTCPVCTLHNDALKLQCIACNSQRPPRRSDNQSWNEYDGAIESARAAQSHLMQLFGKNAITKKQFEQITGALQSQETAARRQQVRPPTTSPSSVVASLPTPVEPNDPFTVEGPTETVTKHWYDWDTKTWQEKQIEVKIDWRPMAEGNLRVALRMIDFSRPPGKRACVAKFQKMEYFEGYDLYFVDVEMQEYCRAIAKAFNTNNPPKRVSFLEAWAIERHGADLPPNQQVLAAEVYIDPTHYVKYNNNYGFVHPLNRNTPAAFSHFSWEFTNKRAMIVDIQGVTSPTEDLYTDPQIHTADGEGFGYGNCGMEGIQKFFSSHRCNAICRALKLPAVGPVVADCGTVVGLRGRVEAVLAPSAFRISQFVRELWPEPNSATAEDLSLMNMTMEEFNHLAELFTKYDENHDKVLSVAEAVQLLQDNSFTFSSDNVDYIFSGLDKNNDGKVSFKEFVLWFKGFE